MPDPIAIIDAETASLATSGSLKPLDGKSVLVTGATGLIGTYILSTLRQRLRLMDVEIEIYAPRQEEIPDFVAVHGENIDFVVHAAGYGQPSKFLENEIGTILINTETTASLLHTLVGGGHFLFLSSSEVYSGCNDRRPDEDSAGLGRPEHERACYIESKRCGETICHAYRRQFDVSVHIARLALAYGPGVRWDDTRVLNSLIRQGIERKRIQILDRGQAIRTYCYVLDAVEMLFSILLHGKQTTYNVGGRSRVTIRELGEAIARQMDVPFSAAEDDAQGLAGAPSDVSMDISRYCDEFGKSEFVGLDDGLARTIRWHRELYAAR